MDLCGSFILDLVHQPSQELVGLFILIVVIDSLGRCFPFISLHTHVRSFLFILFGFFRRRRPFLFLPGAFDDLVLVLVIVFFLDVVSFDTGSS
jgi:hypothetical protein